MTHPPGSPRVRPTAYPLLHLAKAAVHGHAMIGERVREHAEEAAAAITAKRAAAAAQAAELAAAGPEAGRGAPHPPGG